METQHHEQTVRLEGFEMNFLVLLGIWKRKGRFLLKILKRTIDAS